MEETKRNEEIERGDEEKRNDDALFDALNRAKRKKRRRRWITVLVILAAVACGVFYTVDVLRRRVEASMATEADEVLTYDASFGSISTRVSGSGSIEDVDTEKITVPEGVEIDEVMVKSNAKLRKGDLIATLELTSVLDTMSAVQTELDELDKELASASGDRVNTNVTAGVSGRLKKIYALPKADVAACMVENGALALISLDGKMAVDFESDSLEAGEQVRVERANGSVIDGSVEKCVGNTVTVLVTDNGPEMDEQVRVLNGEGTVLGEGRLYIHSVFRITGFTGTVSGVSFRENMQVNAASIVFNLSDTGYSGHYNSLLKQRREKEEKLLELLGLYQGGALRAPIEGTVLRIDYDENNAATTADTASAASQSGMGAYSMYSSATSTGTGSAAAGTGAGTAQTEEDGIVIVTMSPDVSMRVTIGVDEADILSLERGQVAEVTISSVGEEPFSGLVTEVDRTANSSSGVTTYSAEITFSKGKGMLSGMTADAVINIQGSENVLIVPADAIHKTSAGAFVYTAYDEETKLFGGIVPVEVGISNDDYAEIRSGITDGTRVYYTEKEQNNFFMMMGGPGMGSRPNAGNRR